MPNHPETPDKPSIETPEAPDKVAIGQLIKTLREGMELSQNVFAAEIGIKRPSLSNIESGRTLSANSIRKILDRWPYLAEDLKPALDMLSGTTSDSDGENEFEDMMMRRVSATRPLTGSWFALWEATADNQPVPNIEELKIAQMSKGRLHIKNLAPSPDNPKGGYLWAAECRLFDGQHLLGSYIAVDASIRSKGTMHLVVHSSGKHFAGQWIGCSYDSDYSHGLVVFSREKEDLSNRLRRHREQFQEYPRENDLQ